MKKLQLMAPGIMSAGARQRTLASTLQPVVSRLITAAAHVTTGHAHPLPQHALPQYCASFT